MINSFIHLQIFVEATDIRLGPWLMLETQRIEDRGSALRKLTTLFFYPPTSRGYAPLITYIFYLLSLT